MPATKKAMRNSLVRFGKRSPTVDASRSALPLVYELDLDGDDATLVALRSWSRSGALPILGYHHYANGLYDIHRR